MKCDCRYEFKRVIVRRLGKQHISHRKFKVKCEKHETKPEAK